MRREQARKNVEELVKEQKLKLRYKDTWWPARLLGVLLFWDRRWLQRASVYGKLVLLPPESTLRSPVQYVLWMSYVLARVEDDKRYGAFSLLSQGLAPQLLSLCASFSLLAIWYEPSYLWFLICLVFALPWPSPGRTWYQMRAYAVMLGAYHWVLGLPYSTEPEDLETHFPGTIDRMVGWDYYRMMWSRKNTVLRLGRYLRHPGSLLDLAKRLKVAIKG